jgi:hypothetical protein
MREALLRKQRRAAPSAARCVRPFQSANSAHPCLSSFTQQCVDSHEGGMHQLLRKEPCACIQSQLGSVQQEPLLYAGSSSLRVALCAPLRSASCAPSPESKRDPPSPHCTPCVYVACLNQTATGARARLWWSGRSILRCVTRRGTPVRGQCLEGAPYGRPLQVAMPEYPHRWCICTRLWLRPRPCCKVFRHRGRGLNRMRRIALSSCLQSYNSCAARIWMRPFNVRLLASVLASVGYIYIYIYIPHRGPIYIYIYIVHLVLKLPAPSPLLLLGLHWMIHR